MDSQLFDIVKRFSLVIIVIAVLGALLDSAGYISVWIVTIIELVLVFFMASRMSIRANAGIMIPGVFGALVSAMAGLVYTIAYWISFLFFHDSARDSYIIFSMLIDGMISLFSMAILGLIIGLLGAYLGQRSIERRTG